LQAALPEIAAQVFTVQLRQLEANGLSSEQHSDSYNGIGHIRGVKYRLSNGDTMMKYKYGTGHYHIKPGDSYISDKDHKRHTWKDTTGSQNPSNEDVYRGASAETHVHFHIDAIDGASVHSFLDSHGDKIFRHVHDAISNRLSRSAVV